jgi:hypothetical protein
LPDVGWKELVLPAASRLFPKPNINGIGASSTPTYCGFANSCVFVVFRLVDTFALLSVGFSAIHQTVLSNEKADDFSIQLVVLTIFCSLRVKKMPNRKTCQI